MFARVLGALAAGRKSPSPSAQAHVTVHMPPSGPVSQDGEGEAPSSDSVLGSGSGEPTHPPQETAKAAGAGGGVDLDVVG